MGKLFPVCPLCRGRAVIVDPGRQKQDPPCHLCGGRGHVSKLVCRGCGRPAFEEKEKIFYCGRIECFDRLTIVTVPFVRQMGFIGSEFRPWARRDEDDDTAKWWRENSGVY